MGISIVAANTASKVSERTVTTLVLQFRIAAPTIFIIPVCSPLPTLLSNPFPDATFEAVTSGYLVRNVFDVRRAFREQLRVVKPGGRVVCLDTSPPPPHVLRPLVLVYLKVLIPLLGYLVARDIQAYTYLPDSTKAFLTPARLISVMESAGFQNVRHRQFMLGTQVACVGVRPEEQGT